VKNGDRWQVTHRYQDGSLAVRRLGKGDAPRGKALVLPAGYVANEVELGYASTVHRAQGSTVDTAHALINPDTAARELLYVALTRGRHRNEAYVIQPDPHEVEPHLDQPDTHDVTGQLARVLARSDADLSATETLTLEVDRHASLSTLLSEYDLLAREAQTERWATLLDVAPFAPEVADDVFTSPYYEHLEGALARHDAVGHDVAAILTALAPTIPFDEKQSDPAAQLAALIDRATLNRPSGRGARRRRVAGLLPTPAEPIAQDMQTALNERAALIEASARQAVRQAVGEGEGWTSRLGNPPRSRRDRAAWFAHAATIALYRHRYDIAGPAPLDNPKDITKPQQATEYRAAYAALRQARGLAERHEGDTRRRSGPEVDRSRRL
jgi:hypothetical protein